MSEKPKLRSIRCTACGAPLQLHGGGHKILTLNCQYCGTIMDVQQEYAVLAQFKNQQKPTCPLEIGMQGRLKEVDFTIIGMVGRFAETYWVDLLLFSPTHGYAWLTYDHGHFTFARRTRAYLPHQLQAKSIKDLVQGKDQQVFRIYEYYEATITYVAGELTWKAKVGDKNRIAEAIAPPLFLSAEFSAEESEVYVGEYLEPELVYKSFKLTDQTIDQPSDIHPAQPFHAPWLQALSKVSTPFALLALMVVLVIWLLFSGREVYHGSFDLAELKNTPQTTTFTINNANRLVALNLDTTLRNAWMFFEVTLLKGNTEIYSIGKEVSYYEGYEDGESWSEGSREARALFKVPEAGQYTLIIEAPEGGVNESSTRPTGVVSVKVYEGFVGKRYFFALLILALLGILLYPWRRWRFETKRWNAVMDD
ncbi:DUF4178 domain-containing protein [Thiolinea disciformis]|uniref:DUF4178 domain-containing protein n=1 Tax=Thiolinea disciformis TaxID=125614 RepID=UPI00037E7221|nr:DUF4178 domain-containing protein [Thiolinea disciformis]